MRPTLDPEHLLEAKLVSKMTLGQMLSYAEENKKGLLYKHLKNLVFGPASAAPKGAAVAASRGVFVAKRPRRRRGGPSTVCGNQSRKSQIKRGLLKKGSRRHTRLKRGVNPKARRVIETANRTKR